MYHAIDRSGHTLPELLAKSRHRPLTGKLMQDEASLIPKSRPEKSWHVQVAEAMARIGTDAWGAIVLIVLGWFFFDTLRVEWGLLRQGIHFYELMSVMRSPARFFLNSEGSHGTATVPFTLVCMVALLAPLTPYLWRHRLAWLTLLAPLALIFVVAAWLYFSASGDALRESGLGDTIGNDFRHLANHLLRNASATVARKVTFGVGGYVALAGSGYLAFCGLRAFRRSSSFERGPR